MAEPETKRARVAFADEPAAPAAPTSVQVGLQTIEVEDADVQRLILQYLKEQGREHELSPGRSPRKSRNINKPEVFLFKHAIPPPTPLLYRRPHLPPRPLHDGPPSGVNPGLAAMQEK